MEVDANFYSVPWHLIKQSVTIQLIGTQIKILHGAEEVARHPINYGKRKRCINRRHLDGIVKPADKANSEKATKPQLLRPLSEYEVVVGGTW